MYPVSARWRAAISRSHRVVSRVELRSGDIVVADSSQLTVLDGSVKFDQTAAVRRTCEVTLQCPASLVPTFTRRTVLDPFGNELRVSRGIDYGLTGTAGPELVPLGAFRVETTSVTDGPAGDSVVTLSGYDRSDAISRSTYERPYAIASGTNIADAVAAIVADRSSLPTTPEMFLTAVTETTPLHLLEEGADPWTDGVQQLAIAAGCEAYFDVSGTFILRPEPQVLDPAVVTLSEGPGCTILELDREYTPGPNGVIITGESSFAGPTRGEAFDLNPSSPTYWYGRYGRRPKWETHPLAITSLIAARIARTRLLQLSGAGEQVTLRMIPDASLHEGDVVHLRRRRSGLDDLLMLQSGEIPLTHANPMPVVFRDRRVLSAA